MDPVETKIHELAELQSKFLAQAKTDIDSFGRVAQDTKTALEETRGELKKLQTQTDAIDLQLKERHAAGAASETKSLEDVLKDDPQINEVVTKNRRSGSITLTGKQMARVMQYKDIITSTAVGVATSGVLQIDRIPGITPEARQDLTVRDALTARPTNMQVIDFVRVKTAPVKGSPQVEASDKLQNKVEFESKSEKVRTLATWIPASRQILDDFTELAGYLNTALPYYVNLDEEVELLSGDGTGEHLDGLITQASQFSTAYLSVSKGWNKIDIIGRVIEQITVAKETQPTFIMLNPIDWWDVRLTKDGFGRYILGDPQITAPPSLFGKQVIVTTSVASGTFLVGSGLPIASEIRDRMEMQIEISREHSDYFVKNLVAIRAEKRLALVVKRPASYITGSFTTSPA
jgi:HK97 family phage major capsid protein